MFLLISKYPSKENEQDGMVQRIAAVDSMLDGRKRVYLAISFRRFLKVRMTEVQSHTRVIEAGAFFGFIIALCLCFFAKRIYVHSILNSAKILPIYFLNGNIVTDMHGIVSEEFALQGRSGMARIFNFIERVVCKRSLAIVTVSEAMGAYLRSKHSISNKSVNVPIFDRHPVARRGKSSDSKPTVIYAGGTQAWQNVDLMCQSIKELGALFSVVILSGDLVTFRDRLQQFGLVDSVSLFSVPKHEVYSWYQRADLGFILRADIPVNNVACPTKLVEYLANGVVPVVIQPYIGDFASLGYAYVLLSNLVAGKTSVDEIVSKRETNFGVIARYYSEVDEQMKNFQRLLAV